MSAPEPQGCGIHPAILWLIGAISAVLWLCAFPALRWLCLTVDALRDRIF